MLDLVTAAYDNINLNLHTGLVFIDLKKAFDTFFHKILLNKLAHYGIRGVAFNLLSSFSLCNASGRTCLRVGAVK